MSNESLITTALQPDPPLVQDPNYRFDTNARQFVDNQIVGTQKHIATCLINGTVATYILVDGTSPALVAGDVVCLAGSVVSYPTVTKATASALNVAGNVPYGVVLIGAGPGTRALIAIGGVVSPLVTGLGPFSGVVRSLLARPNRAESFAVGDIVLGSVDQAGFLTLAQSTPFSTIGGVATVADDIAISGAVGNPIDRCVGFRGVPLANVVPGLGETWVKRGASYVAKKPVMPGRYDVMDFGAVGNNIADDTTAITNAILAARAAGSGIVYLPPGKYKVTASLPDLATEDGTTSIHLEGALLPGFTGLGNGGIGSAIHSYINTAPIAGRSCHVVSMGHVTDANWQSWASVKNLEFYSEVDQFFLMAGVSVASDGAVLPQATINVTSTASFPTSGTLTVQTSFGAQRVSYSGKTGTSFTGCTSTYEQGLGTLGGTTIAAGSNGASLPQATVSVTSNMNFPTSGTVLISTSLGPQRMTYTGKGAGTLTGCSGGLGVMSTGGVVGTLLASFDDLKANGCAAIEATGVGQLQITNCKTINYPIGILLDGAVTVFIDKFFNGGDGHGYKPVNTDSIGIACLGTLVRPGHFAVSSATNDVHIRGFDGGGGTGVLFEGGFAFSITNSTFEGGVRCVHLVGTNNVIIDQIISEGYSGECIYCDGSLNVSIQNCILGGAGSPMGAVPSIRFGSSASSQANITNNQVGGSIVRGGAAILNAAFVANHVYALGNILSAAGGVQLFDYDYTSGGSLVFNVDGGVATGLGINILKSPVAVVDGYKINGQTLLHRVAAGTPNTTKDMYVHALVTPKSHHVHYASASFFETNDSGVDMITDYALQQLTDGGATVNACVYAIPDITSVLAEFTMIQKNHNDPTKYAVYKCSQVVRRNGASLIFDGALLDDVAVRSTDGAFVHPTLADDGTHKLCVVVTRHPTFAAVSAQLHMHLTILSQ